MAISESSNLPLCNSTTVFLDRKDLFILAIQNICDSLWIPAFSGSVSAILSWTHHLNDSSLVQQAIQSSTFFIHHLYSIDYKALVSLYLSHLHHLFAQVHDRLLIAKPIISRHFHSALVFCAKMSLRLRGFANVRIMPLISLSAQYLLKSLAFMSSLHKILLPGIYKICFYFVFAFTCAISAAKTLLHAFLLLVLKLAIACIVFGFRLMGTSAAIVFNTLAYVSNMSLMVLYVKPLSYIIMLALGVGAGFGIIAGTIILVVQILLPSNPTETFPVVVKFETEAKPKIEDLEKKEEAKSKSRRDTLSRLDQIFDQKDRKYERQAPKQSVKHGFGIGENETEDVEIDFSKIHKSVHKAPVKEKYAHVPRTETLSRCTAKNSDELSNLHEDDEHGENINSHMGSDINDNSTLLNDSANADIRISSQSSNESLSPSSCSSISSNSDENDLYECSESKSLVWKPQLSLDKRLQNKFPPFEGTTTIIAAVTTSTPKKPLRRLKVRTKKAEVVLDTRENKLYEDEDGYSNVMNHADDSRIFINLAHEFSKHIPNSYASATNSRQSSRENTLESGQVSPLTTTTSVGSFGNMDSSGRHHIKMMKRPPKSWNGSELHSPVTQRTSFIKPLDIQSDSFSTTPTPHTPPTASFSSAPSSRKGSHENFKGMDVGPASSAKEPVFGNAKNAQPMVGNAGGVKKSSSLTNIFGPIAEE